MKKRAGFTLIELVIGIAIMLIIFGGIVYIFGASSKSAMAGMNHKQAYESARSFMDEIKTTMRYADTINLDSTNGTLTYAVTYDTTTKAVQHPFYEEHFSKDIANGKACYYNYTITWKDSNKTQLKIVRSITPVKEGSTDQGTTTTKTFYFPTDDYVKANGAFKATEYTTKLDKGAFAAFPVIEKSLTNSGTTVYGIAIPIQYKDATGTTKVDILQTEVQSTNYTAYDEPTPQQKAEILLTAVTSMYNSSSLTDQLKTSDKKYTNNISSSAFNQSGLKGITKNLKNYIGSTSAGLSILGDTAWVIAAVDEKGKVLNSHQSSVYGWKVFIAKNAINDVNNVYAKSNAAAAYLAAAKKNIYIVRPDYGVKAYAYLSNAQTGTIAGVEQLGYMTVINVSNIIMLNYNSWVSAYTDLKTYSKLGGNSTGVIEDQYDTNNKIATTGSHCRIDYDEKGKEYTYKICKDVGTTYSYPPNAATYHSGS